MTAEAFAHFEATMMAALTGTRDELRMLRMQVQRREQLAEIRAHMTQSEVITALNRQVFEDAVAAGWLKPCSRSKITGKATVFYPRADVREVSLRIVAGEYPLRKEVA